MAHTFGRRRRPRASKHVDVPDELEAPDELDVELLDTQMEMTSSLMFSVEMKEHQLGIVSHCARVSLTAGWLARQVGVQGDAFHDVQFAARMHEVGMISVPPVLLRKRGALTPDELERIRSQARIGAEIARTLRRPLAALLIEHQYTDYAELETLVSPRSREFLLVGLLRVADVFDAMTTPRPYQNALPEQRRIEILRAGAGTKFHPRAVEALLHGWGGG